MYQVDVIILSYAKNEALKKITEQAIDSLINSENTNFIQFNILIIESNKTLSPYQYKYTKTIYPSEKFGFNCYLNLGIKMTSSPYVCLCNNDLIFGKNWATEILKEIEKNSLLLSTSPYCPIFHSERGFTKYSSPLLGYDNGVLVGWCIFVKREIFEIIGYLDEKLTFWYCDNDYSQTLQYHKVKHCLISSSFVTHLSNQTINVIDSKNKENLTNFQRLYYEYKWKHKSRLILFINTLLLQTKLLIKYTFSIFSA